jgi:hypothetical protein
MKSVGGVLENVEWVTVDGDRETSVSGDWLMLLSV